MWRWIWLLGPGVARPAVAGTCEAVAPALEVATLNTWGLPYPLSRDRRARFGRIREYLAAGVDVVGLEEVWRSARPLLAHHLRTPDDRDGDSGLAVVTPHGSTRPVLRRFRDATGPDRFKAKGVLTTRLDLPDGEPTWVMVTHLQAGRGARASRVRGRQVRELLEVLAGLAGPALVMGDFNLYDDLPDDQASARALAGAGLVDAAEAARGATPTYPAQAARLDRIYLRDGTTTALSATRVAVGDGRGLSDHAPVTATIERCAPPGGTAE